MFLLFKHEGFKMQFLIQIVDNFNHNVKTTGGKTLFGLVVFSFCLMISFNIYKSLYESKNAKKS